MHFIHGTWNTFYHLCSAYKNIKIETQYVLNLDLNRIFSMDVGSLVKMLYRVSVIKYVRNETKFYNCIHIEF